MKMIRDVNGGYWGLIIIFSAFMIQFFAFGIGLSIGLYNIEFLTLTNDAFAVSLVSAINTGVFLGSGPLVSLLMNFLNHRTVALIGAALSSSAMLCMPFLPSLQYMYAIYGVIAGLGFSFVYIPSHVLSGLYYMKHQSMSTGIATSGSGFGLTVFPILVGYLIETYTWRPSLLVLAGLTFNLFVFALLLRPLPKSSISRPQEEVVMLNEMDAHNSKLPEEKEKRLKHFYVFCDVKFDIFFINNICWNTGGNVVMMFGPDFLTTRGYSKIHTATIYTVLGFSCFLGSILTGIIGNLPRVNRLVLYAIVCLGAGISTICLPYVTTEAGMTIAHLGFGLGFGGVLGLLVVLTADILGPESLGDGVGYLMLANGVGCFAGPPIAGALKNYYGDYNVALITAGVLIIVGTLLMILMPIHTRLCQKNMASKEYETEIPPSDKVSPNTPLSEHEQL